MAVVYAMLASYLLVAHADSHHGALHAEAGSEAVRAGRARRDRRRHGPHLEGALHIQPPLRIDALLLHFAARLGARSPRPRAGGFGFFVAARFAGGFHRPRLLPHGGFRPDAPACPRAFRNPHRADRGGLRQHRTRDSRRDSARRIGNIIDNIGIPNGGFNLAFGDNPTIGVGDGDILISLNPEKHGPTAEYTPTACASACTRNSPTSRLLLRSRQHHQPDSELRTARPHRRAGGGPQRRRQLQDRRQAAIADRRHSRRGRRAHPPGGRLSRNPRQRGPLQGRAWWGSRKATSPTAC
jgi:hypothetical protein